MDVRDPVHGNIPLSDAEVKVVDSRAYQRLRQIKQLGFSEFAFPGATHNRYLHSLGVTHLAGMAFDAIFAKYTFSNPGARARLRQVTRLAALLHDVGHGPLSHASEEVMPPLARLGVDVYRHRATPPAPDQQANHEDYTIKLITDSDLTRILEQNFGDITPFHVAALIDKSLGLEDDFFRDGGFDFRVILSQIVSSEMDVDRMDYLERDAYFCGTNYGKVELGWLMSNLAYHVRGDKMHLALNRRALYAFDDFLLARHHMHLMVYFHHKSIIFEEMLYRYFTSPDCSFQVPADPDAYLNTSDYGLWQHLGAVENPWARRMAERRPYRMLFELHSDDVTGRPERITSALEAENIPTIHASSQVRLSKYHGTAALDQQHPIYVVDRYDYCAEPYPIEETTEIFLKYENIRRIDRIYVSPELYDRAETFLMQRRI